MKTRRRKTISLLIVWLECPPPAFSPPPLLTPPPALFYKGRRMTSAEAKTLLPPFLDFVKTLQGDEKSEAQKHQPSEEQI